MASSPQLSPEELTQSRGGSLRAVFIAMYVIPGVAVAIRLWSRALLAETRRSLAPIRFWWDDLLVTLSYLIVVVMNSLGLRLVDLGYGRHIQTVASSYEQVTLLLKFTFAEEFLYHLGITLAKSSAVFFYTRLFDVSSISYRWSLYISQGLIWGWLFGSWFGTVFQCNPVRKAWLPQMEGKCANQELVWLAIAIPNLIIDLIILLLPMPKLLKLKVDPIHKLGLIALFILGYGEIIVTVGETIALVKAGPSLQTDLTWNSVTYVIWLFTGIPIAICTICLPSAVFLVRRARTRGLRSLLSSGGTSKIPLNNSTYTRKWNGKTPSSNGSSKYNEADTHHSGQDGDINLNEIAYDRNHESNDPSQETSIIYGKGASNYHSAAQDGIHVRQDFVITSSSGSQIEAERK